MRRLPYSPQSVEGTASYGLTELRKAANREEAGTLRLIPVPHANITEVLFCVDRSSWLIGISEFH